MKITIKLLQNHMGDLYVQIYQYRDINFVCEIPLPKPAIIFYVSKKINMVRINKHFKSFRLIPKYTKYEN